jgi:catechol 2,3-dioxygenase-like lactoylglutathione lyase family enzyme
MLKGIANIWMPVQDIERAVDFYENILGLPVVKRDGPWAEVDANGVISLGAGYLYSPILVATNW